MKIFSRKEKKDELALVFDLGSSSVGGVLFLVRKSKSPKIIFSIREDIKFEDKIDFNKFLSATMKALDMVASRVSASGLGAPTSFFCVLSSPWYSSQVRMILLKKNVPFIFTSKLADDLIKKENFLLQEEYKNESKVRLIELKNMKTMLNGYMVNKPLGKETQEIEMSIFTSKSPEEVLSSIEEVVQKHFHRKTIRFSSFTLASFSVARDIFLHQDDFILIDIGGEITQLDFIKKNTVCSSASFPLGYNYFIRGLASSLKCSLDEAKANLSFYKSNHASKKIKDKIKPIIEKLKSEWVREFQKILAFLSNDIFISSTIFMTVDEELAEFFIETIKNEEFAQYTFTESKFKIIHLSTQMLHGIAEYEKNVKRDPFLTIESVYINRFLM